MTQFLILAKPRSGAVSMDASYVFRRTDNPDLIKGAKLALGASDDDAVFTVTSPAGDPFETWFDAVPFDAERTDQLVDACAHAFSSLALFYGDARDLERAGNLDDLKSIIRLQFNNVPVELYAVWTE